MWLEMKADLSLDEAQFHFDRFLADLRASGCDKVRSVHIFMQPMSGSTKIEYYQRGEPLNHYNYIFDEMQPLPDPAYEKIVKKEFLRNRDPRGGPKYELVEIDEQKRALWNWLVEFCGKYFEDEEPVSAAWNFVGRDVSYRFPEASLTSEEFDKVELLKEIVDILIRLLGSEDSAGNWLLKNEDYQRFSGSQIYEELESGTVSCLILLVTTLTMIAERRMDGVLTLLSNDLIPFGIRV